MRHSLRNKVGIRLDDHKFARLVDVIFGIDPLDIVVHTNTVENIQSVWRINRPVDEIVNNIPCVLCVQAHRSQRNMLPSCPCLCHFPSS